MKQHTATRRKANMHSRKILAFAAILVGVIGAARSASAWPPTGLPSPTRQVTLTYDNTTHILTGYYQGIEGDHYTAHECVRGNPAMFCWGDSSHISGGVLGESDYDASNDAGLTEYTLTVRFYDAAKVLLTTMTATATKPDVPPSNLAYSPSTRAAVVGVPMGNMTPSSSGGVVVSYSISPALPSGLSIDETSGVISGTPTAGSLETTYTVTATNTGGSTTANVTIIVAGP